MKEQSEKIANVQTLLKFTFGIVPIVAGADKFTMLLTDWARYLSPTIHALLPLTEHQFLMFVGLIEIVLGIVVFLNPQKGGYLVSVWLVLIAIDLLISGNYIDIAVRDLVMAIGAFSLAKLSEATNFKKA